MMTLRTRMTAAMIVLVVATAISVAWLANLAFGAQGLPEALDALGSDTRLLAATLQATAIGAAADILTFGRLDVAAAVAEGGSTTAEAEAQLADLFAAALAVKQRYLQLRFIDTTGFEVVRVDRRDGRVHSVPQVELQDKSERPYVQGALSLQPGDLYVSPVQLNEEEGELDVPYVPVVRLATPVASSSGVVGGFIIVNMDMRSVLATLKRDAMDRGRELYIMSASEYLLHPDHDREFERSRGLSRGWSDDFPDLPPDLANEVAWTGLADIRGESVGVAVRGLPLAGGPRVVVLTTEPEAQLMAGPRRVVTSAVLGGGLVALMATVLAALLARSLSRPMARLAGAVARFETAGDWDVPSGTTGEVGVLADTLDRAIRSEREKHAELEEQIEIRRETEAKLEREAARLRHLSTVAQSSLDGIYTMTAEGTVTSWNPGAERLYGYTADDMVGRHISVLVRDDDRPEVEGVLERLRSGEAVRDYETVRLTRQGEGRDVSLTLSPVRDDAGAVGGISAIARDIGERKALEERFRLSVEACPNGMVMVDESGVVVLVNREVERLFGYSREELLGESIEKLVPEAARGAHPGLRRRFAGEPRRRAMGSGRDLFGRRKDGAEIPVEIGLNPIQAPDGLFVLASIVDISERLKAQEELRRSNEDLEQFAYVASHDLQEPLRMVASYTELLAQRYEGQLDERADKYIRYAVDGAKRMQLLITDLLRFSRIDSQSKPFAPTELNAVVQEVIDARLAAALHEAGGTVAVAELPVVQADEVQIGQVFQNLISNALKFRPEDRPPEVHVAAERQGPMWLISVRDNGIGIEEEYAERIFEMFQRLHGVGTYSGSGIGLTLTRKIVRRHGGQIWFESTPGSGTTFYFTLPVDER